MSCRTVQALEDCRCCCCDIDLSAQVQLNLGQRVPVAEAPPMGLIRREKAESNAALSQAAEHGPKVHVEAVCARGHINLFYVYS